MGRDLNKSLGQRIRKLRERLGLSQKALASEMGFGSSETVSKIELGQRKVKAWELAKLARILLVDLSELLATKESSMEPVLWREVPKADRELKEANFLKRCQEYALVEELSGPTRFHQFTQRKVDPDLIDFNDAPRLAMDIRQVFNLGDRPALALEKTLQYRYGIKVWYDELDEGSAAAAVGSFGLAILMNSKEPPWRRNYSFAHEVFHLITWESLPPTLLMRNKALWEKIEKIANYFASCLLLPSDAVDEEVKGRIVDEKISYDDLVEIARSFDVSTEALLYRLLNLRFVNERTVASLLEDKTFREIDRSTMADHWRNPPKFPERFVRLAFLACQKGRLSKAKLAQLLDTSLFDLPHLLQEYGLDDRKSYNVKVRAA